MAVGNGYRDNILGKVNIPDRVSVVTNGVDLKLFQPQEKDREFLQSIGWEGKFVCSYVGTIGMAHGLNVVVEAARHLKASGQTDIGFCIVGDGATRQELEQQVSAAGVQDLVVLTGRLPKSEMPKVLASSDCLLIHLRKTDLFETVIPSKIFEAMGMGRPLIMGVQGEAAKIVENSGTGIQIESDNPNQLVDAVLTLHGDPQRYKQLSAAGPEFVARYYSRDQLAADYMQILKKVAAG